MRNPNMNEDRIQRFILLLEADRVNPTGVKFDMDWWCRPAKATSINGYIDKVIQPDISCNTNACALGLAAISGVFKDEGLTYEQSGGQLVPIFGNMRDFDAGAAFFGIGPMEAGALFDPYYYPAALRQGAAAEQEVVNRLRWLLQHRTLKEYDFKGRIHPSKFDVDDGTIDAGTQD